MSYVVVRIEEEMRIGERKKIERNNTEKKEEKEKEDKTPKKGKTEIRELTSQSGLSCPLLSKVATSELKQKVINNQSLVTKIL